MTARVNECVSCGAPRGNKRKGWHPVKDSAPEYGWTCPACPRWDEPIRRRTVQTGTRFRAVVDATAPGAAKRKQKTKTHASLEDARAWVAAMRDEVALFGSLDRHEVTVREQVDRWLSHAQVRPTTRVNYGYQVRGILTRIGDTPVATLTARDVEAAVRFLQVEGGKDGGPLGHWAVTAGLQRVQQALDSAVRDGLVETNVARLVARPKPVRTVGGELTHWPSEGVGNDARCPAMDKFRAASDLDRYAPFWRLSLCGLTRADVMGLQWRDFDLTAGTVTVRRSRVAGEGGASHVDAPKSRQRRRTVPYEAILPGTTAMLRAFMDLQQVEAIQAGWEWSVGAWAATSEAGDPLRPDVYASRFHALVESAGVPAIGLHHLRHTLALLLHRLGVAPADAAALLGHRVDVHMSAYLPEGGAAGIAAAAAALAAVGGDW